MTKADRAAQILTMIAIPITIALITVHVAMAYMTGRLPL